MSSATSSAGVTDYVYNALGQLIEKSGDGGTTLLVYDEAGHVLGEYTSAGALVQETVLLSIRRGSRCGATSRQVAASHRNRHALHALVTKNPQVALYLAFRSHSLLVIVGEFYRG